jgi:hypothetical protein
MPAAQTRHTEPSHVCQQGQQVGAFFESPAEEVTYEVCVTFSNEDRLCKPSQLAEPGTLYVNPVTTNILGTHLVT